MTACQSGSGSREANEQSVKSGSGVENPTSSRGRPRPSSPWQAAQAWLYNSASVAGWLDARTGQSTTITPYSQVRIADAAPACPPTASIRGPPYRSAGIAAFVAQAKGPLQRSAGTGSRLDHDAFDLVERDRVRRPVVELRRLRRRVPGDPLRVLERPPVRQVRRDARRPKRVAARRRRQPCRHRPPFDHRQHGPTPQRPPTQLPRPVHALKQGRPRVLEAPAATYASTASSARWWAGTSWRFPPFSCSRSHPRSSCRK